MADLTEFLLGGTELSVDDIVALAEGRARLRLSRDAAFVGRMEASRKALQTAMDSGAAIYGVTTGFGRACGKRIEAESTLEMSRNMTRFHGCGVGEPLPEIEVRAAMVCRLLSLARGYSGVGLELLQALVDMLNAGVTPLIPSQGSVGASGDLTPLNYLVAVMMGEREAFYQGRRMASAEALEAAELKPYEFQPKEVLAVMNGTSVMTGIAAVACVRAGRLLDAATMAAAFSVHALAGHAHHFEKGVFEAKPFPGQARVAARLRELLTATGPVEESQEAQWLQDPYSLRCTPQVLGVLADALDWMRPWIECEANSANDNPLFDPESGAVWTAGNFFGGHVAFAMDGLKAALARVADLADRQFALLIDVRFSRGLPADLVPEEAGSLHHGFKAIQILTSSLAVEMAKDCMPAAVFSRSTESHNQDTVSLGTIAARDASRLCLMGARLLATHLLAGAQAAELRGGVEHRPALADCLGRVRKHSSLMVTDRVMDREIEELAQLLLEPSSFEVL